MAEEDEDGEQEPKAKGSSKKLIMIIVIALVVIGATVGGLFAAGIIGASPDGEDAEHSEGEDEDSEEAAGPAVYIPIEPAFVVNFTDTDKARFLQITMEVMSRNPEVPALIETHLPAIRNNLVLLFSSQTYEVISTLEGKEALREETLIVVQEILEEETGDEGIEAVYFTSIVMQ